MDKNIIYKLDLKNKEIKKWYLHGIEFIDDCFYILVKDNNRNKNKFITEKISFKSFGNTAFLTSPEAEQALNDYTERKEYTITFKCGHKDTVRLKGTPFKVKARINELEKLICPVCRNKESEKQGCIAIEMPYSEYKKKYYNCDTKVGSYNKENSTIQVYINQNQ